MLKHDACVGRSSRLIEEHFDLVVVGGGLAGVCTSITAARQGLRVGLVQDRPVLGGNASSEVRLWVLGATSHMGNNNRWAREGGVIDEILVENMFRNPEGNPVIVDALLLEKTSAEKNITLLLNTAVYEVEKDEHDGIRSVRGFCSQNGTQYLLHAPLFCDASGDGILGFLSGAAFRMGAEARSEFGELMAPVEASNHLLGHSLYFYARDAGRPVRYTRPSFALADISAIPRYRSFSPRDQGCQLWWIEFGGSRDTVHDTEAIKWELWRIVYGVWDHIKNSGQFPEAENLTLEWVGSIPGKRESRRFEGDYMLTQQDVVEQRQHYDAVSFGGWAIDLHPVDGVYSSEEPCTQYHSKGLYQIPFRTMYSRNVANLFLAGRIISASHIAFGSTRVMATCSHSGQAVGVAAAMCRENNWAPRDLSLPERIQLLQQRLLRSGQFIPGVMRRESADLSQRARLFPSSEEVLAELPPGTDSVRLTEALGLLLPLAPGTIPRISFDIVAPKGVTLEAELRTASRRGNFTPDVLLETAQVEAQPAEVAASISAGVRTDAASHGPSRNGHPVGDRAMPAPHLARRGGAAARMGSDLVSTTTATAVAEQGHAYSSKAKLGPPLRIRQTVAFEFQHVVAEQAYMLVALQPNPEVEVLQSDWRAPGMLTLRQRGHASVAKGSSQDPPPGAGIDAFDFWTPERRPRGKNPAVRFDPPLACYSVEQAVNGVGRPTNQVNGWAARRSDPHPSLTLVWPEPQQISIVEVVLDTDADHPMESVLIQHPERIMPHCVQNLRLKLPDGRLLAAIQDNHQTRVSLVVDPPVQTSSLILELDRPESAGPAFVFEVKCYGPPTADAKRTSDADEASSSRARANG